MQRGQESCGELVGGQGRAQGVALDVVATFAGEELFLLLALDAFGASLLGVEAASLQFIALAEQAGLGRARDESRKVVAIND